MRYSDLLNSSTGQLTAVGQIFVSEYINLQHCGAEGVIGSSVESVVSTDDDTLVSTGTEQETEVELKIGLKTETKAPNLQPIKMSEPTTGGPVPFREVEDYDEATADTPDVSFVESEDGTRKSIIGYVSFDLPRIVHGETLVVLFYRCDILAGLDVNTDSEAITSVVITNVGGSGYFDMVVNMIDGENGSCPSSEDTCVREVRRRP